MSAKLKAVRSVGATSVVNDVFVEVSSEPPMDKAQLEPFALNKFQALEV